MAFIREYGRPEAAPGVPFELADPESKEPVTFYFRPVPDAITAQIEAKYGAEQTVQGEKGSVFKQRVHSFEDLKKIATDKAVYALVDTKGLRGKALDEEGARTWSRLLGEEVGVGQEFTLDGRLTNNIRRHVYNQDADLAVWSAKCAASLDAKEYAIEKVLRGNS